MGAFIIILVLLIVVLLIIKSIKGKKASKKRISIHSPEGIKFWVYIDNILQNQHSETSLLIYDIPVNDDSTSLLEVTLDLGNGNIARISGEKLKLTSTAKYFTINASGKKPALKSTSSFVAQAEVKCSGVKPGIDSHEEYVPPKPRNKPAAKKTTAAKPKAEKKTTEKKTAEKATKAQTASKPKAKSAIDEYIEAVNAFYSQTEKKAAIQHIISSNKLTASQIKQLADLVIFDDDKAELLEFAYPYCKDKSNYIKTVNILVVPANKKRILEMIG